MKPVMPVLDRVVRVIVVSTMLLNLVGLGVAPVAAATAQETSAASQESVPANAADTDSSSATDSGFSQPLVGTPAQEVTPTVGLEELLIIHNEQVVTDTLAATVTVDSNVGGELIARDNRVKVKFPPRFLNGRVQASFTRVTPPSPRQAARQMLSLERAFELKVNPANPKDGKLPDKFSHPVTVTIDATGQIEYPLPKGQSLWVGYYDDVNDKWVSAAFSIDEGPDGDQLLLQVPTDHFSIWAYGNNLDAGWLPMFNEPQVALFSGAAVYNYPIDIPPGRGGLQPQLNLGYSSRGVDGILGWSQSGWVGMGWSLDLVSISRAVQRGGAGAVVCKDEWRLTFNGTGYRLVKGEEISGVGVRYYTLDHSQLYIVRRNGRMLGGGLGSDQNMNGEYWLVRDPQGRQYRLGFNATSEVVQGLAYGCTAGATDSTYGGDTWNVGGNTAGFWWHVDQITDTLGNAVTISYTQPTEDEIYLDQITYNGGLTQIKFNLAYDGGDGHSLEDPVFFRRYHLDNIVISQNGTSLQKYQLTTVANPDSYGYGDPGSRVLTGIQQYNGAGTAGLPKTVFEYARFDNQFGVDGCTNWEACFGFPYYRLVKVDNGYGARTTFTYAHDGADNYSYRVIAREIYSGRASPPALYEYVYGTPCYDTDRPWGLICRSPLPPYPHVAKGYDWVTVTARDYNGAVLSKSKHYFRTDEVDGKLAGREYKTETFDAAGVVLQTQISNYALVSTPGGWDTRIFQQDSRTADGRGGYLTHHQSFTYDWLGNQIATYDYGAEEYIPDPGFEASAAGWTLTGSGGATTSQFFAGQSSMALTGGSITTTISGLTPGTPYVIRAWGRTTSGTPQTLTLRVVGANSTPISTVSTTWVSGSLSYTPSGSSFQIYLGGTPGVTYFVDEVAVARAADVGDERTTYAGYHYNASNGLIALAWRSMYGGIAGSPTEPYLNQVVNFYDYSSTLTPPVKGLLTQVWNRNWDSSLLQKTFYAYDPQWGNVISTTDNANRTTLTEYDSLYHVYPVAVTLPITNSVTRSEYYGLNAPADGQPFGLLKQVINPNNQVTRYVYDGFGRVIQIFKPGDTGTPAVQYDYRDTGSATFANWLTLPNSNYGFEYGGDVDNTWSGGGTNNNLYPWTGGWGRARYRGHNGQWSLGLASGNWSDNWLANWSIPGWQAGAVYGVSAWVSASASSQVALALNINHQSEIWSPTYAIGSNWQLITAFFTVPMTMTNVGLMLRQFTPNVETLLDDVQVWQVLPPMEIGTYTRDSDAGGTQWTRRVFDGQGRVIQTQTEKDGNQVFVVNTAYNAAGAVVSSTVPVERTSAPSGLNYLTPDWTLPRTTSEYDMLGRVVRATAPDGTFSLMGYDAQTTTPVDTNGNWKLNTADVFGRVTSVQEPQTIFTDTFNSLNTGAWTFAGQTIESGTIKSVGTGTDWSRTFYRKLTRDGGIGGQGAQLEFKVANNGGSTPQTIIAMQAPSGQPSRRFGINIIPDRIQVQYSSDGSTWFYPDLVAPTALNSWYVLRLTIQADGQGKIEIWPKDNPTQRRVYLAPMPDGISYQFQLWTRSGISWLDNYQEFDLATTRYAYSPLDQLVRVTDALSHTTVITYNALGQKIAMNDPDMGRWTYQYDKAGNLITQTDALSQSLVFSYDSLNRLVSKSTITATALVRYAYDEGGAAAYALGQRTTMTDTSGTTRWVYDQRGRVLSEIRTITNAGIYTTSYTYDTLDRVKTITYPTGEVVQQNYNNAGQLNSVAGLNTYASNITYDAAGRLTLLPLGNSLTTIYSYYPWTSQGGRLQRIQTENLQDLNYQYDASGNVRSILDLAAGTPVSEVVNYTYDPLDRLVQASGAYTETYSYDAIGNMTAKNGLAYTYTNPAHVHAVTGVGITNTYTYDANGNMLIRLENGKRYTQTWDIENRLTSVTSISGTVQFVYDGNGQRVMQILPNGDKTVYVNSLLEIDIPAGGGGLRMAGADAVSETETEKIPETEVPTGTPSATATATPEATLTVTPTASETLTPVSTATETLEAAETNTETPTLAPTADTPTATASVTETPTAGNTERTRGAIISLPTFTRKTKVAPEITPSATALPTDAPTADVATPTATETPTAVETATATIETLTWTPTASETVPATATETPANTPTGTPVATDDLSKATAGAPVFKLNGVTSIYTPAPRRHAFVSSAIDQPAWLPNNAIDDVSLSAWSSIGYTGANNTEWLAVDTGDMHSLKQVILLPRNNGSQISCFPENFKFQYSITGTLWSDVPGASYTGYANPTTLNGETFTFASAVNARYLRLQATKLRADSYGAYYLQMADMYVYVNTGAQTATPVPTLASPMATPLITPTVLQQGLVAYWSLDEASGQRADALGVSNLSDGNTVTRAGGKGNWAARFQTANSEYLSAPDSGVLSTGNVSFTLAAWVYLENKNADQMLVGKWKYDGNNREYGLSYSQGLDRFLFAVSGDGAATAYITSTVLGSPSPGEWYFIVGWHDPVAGTINIQVNNNSTVDSLPYTGGVKDGTAEFRMAARNVTGQEYYLNGRLDNVGLWKRVLSATERTALWNNGHGLDYPFTTPRPGPISYWRMNELTGVRYDDLGWNPLADSNNVISATGRWDKAAQFTAALSQTLYTGDNDSLSVGDQDFTLSAWVYLNNKTTHRTFVGKWYFNTPDREYLLLYNASNDRFQFTTSGNGDQSNNSVMADAFGSPVAGQWYFLVGWYDATTGNLSIQVNNGTINTRFHPTGTYNGVADFRVGARSDTSPSYMDGRIDEIGLWKRILTAEERTALYQNGGCFGPGCGQSASGVPAGQVWKSYYFAAGKPVAERVATSNGGNLYYLHGDHLGSVSVVTSITGSVISRQSYLPYGEVRTNKSVGTMPTDMAFTGQYADGAVTGGLMYYNARYFLPGLGRFLSADVIVPGTADSAGGGAATLGYDDKVALTPLTVGFQEPQFLLGLNAETGFTAQHGFWFQLSRKEKQEAKYQFGPLNPQALNRYSYCLENPLRYTDPMGHRYYEFSWEDWKIYLGALIKQNNTLVRNSAIATTVIGGIATLGGGIAGAIIGGGPGAFVGGTTGLGITGITWVVSGGAKSTILAAMLEKINLQTVAWDTLKPARISVEVMTRETQGAVSVYMYAYDENDNLLEMNIISGGTLTGDMLGVDEALNATLSTDKDTLCKTNDIKCP